MQSQVMYSKRKRTAAPDGIFLFALSCIVFLSLLVVDGVIYSGVVSMVIPCVLFAFGASWNLFVWLGKNEVLKHHWINVLITALAVAVQLVAFCISLPHYSTAKAAEAVELSMENVKVVENHAIDTREPLTPFVKKGYLLSCEESTTARDFMVFFNPVNGDYYEMS